MEDSTDIDNRSLSGEIGYVQLLRDWTNAYVGALRNSRVESLLTVRFRGLTSVQLPPHNATPFRIHRNSTTSVTIFFCFIYGCSALAVLDPSPADRKSFTTSANVSKRPDTSKVKPWWPVSFTVRNLANDMPAMPWLYDAMRKLTKDKNELSNRLSRIVERQFELI